MKKAFILTAALGLALPVFAHAEEDRQSESGNYREHGHRDGDRHNDRDQANNESSDRGSRSYGNREDGNSSREHSRGENGGHERHGHRSGGEHGQRDSDSQSN
ncbi:hypothetical protein K2X14_03940 [Acetobacter sp. TBRC 12305]|uniref:Uncharacterized protein n=1 Tax=Acetobacter garciniae TaxID=2817435 RepID=A0A939KM95_9PROT|nr:hypothetical protein [Acetobacter garciniae]MBO1324310.1 hypothetical protein [Acetobacter garciniae]MBX0343999.1 hypothetical protein [Acetobacter garciniae]